MVARSIRIAWKVYLVYGIYMLILGILALAAPQVMYVGQFEAYTGSVFADFAQMNARAGTFIGLTLRVFGCMTVLVGIFKIFIALYPYRKGETWSWWLILVIGVIAYSFMFSYSIILGDVATWMFTLIGVILFLIALLIPAKAMLSKKQKK
ncbi:hypothetical protein IBX65_07110 [Candidatus Aerophobetes bacterium]|nr:hypothetical protein [Candidatus Aerophobetes bacterium]